MELSNNIQEELFKSIETIVNKIVDSQKLTTTVYGTVVEVKVRDSGARRDSAMSSSSKISKNKSLYVVKINGTNYNVSDINGFHPYVGDNVWVLVPSGDYTRAFIIGTSGSMDYSHQYLNGAAGIASRQDHVVTLKAGVVENEGILKNSTGSDITLARVASSGIASDVSISTRTGNNNVQNEVDGIARTYVEETNPYQKMKKNDIWVGPQNVQ